MADKKNNNNNEIYEYIKVVDEKVTQNEKTLKFIMSQQSEQMKELIGSKTDNLRKFFEESIRMQMEIVRNAYEEIISELKNTYEKDLKNREIENIKLSNQKEETIKSSYEAQIETIKGFMENDCQKRIDKCYLDTKNKYEEEKKALIEQHKKEMQTTAEKIYNDAKAEFDKELQVAKTEYDNKLQATKTEYDNKLQAAKTEYDDRLAEVKAWDEKNLQNKLAETEDYFRKAEQRVADEAYANGKTDTEAWHDDVVKQKLEVQAQYFQEEMAKQEQYFNGELENKEQYLKEELAKQEQYYQGELEKQKNDLKMEAERYFAVEAEKIKAECESVAVEQRQAAVDEVSKSAKREYEEKLADLNIWHNKNLCERLEEVKNYYEKKILEKEEEHQNIVRQKLEIQANFFDEEIQNAKAQAREETKAELMSQMDEAARRNEEELKLFLDFYEAKIKPFKKLINIHETTDKRIKDIQLRLQNRFNKTFGNK